MWQMIVLSPVFVCLSLYLVLVLFGHKSKILNYYCKYLLYLSLYVLSSFVAIPVYLFRPCDVRNGTVYGKVMKHVAKLLDVEFQIRDGEYLAVDYGAVVVNNHQSAIDPLGMFAVWETAKRLCVVMKSEIKYSGTFALGAYLGGAIFINRKNAQSAYKTIQATNKALTTNKTKIWIYPEGTRNQNPKRKLLSFKKGAFHMAVQAQVPVIPVVFSPYYFLDGKTHTFDKGHIIMQCLEPIPTAGLTLDDVQELSDRVHKIMSVTYEKLWDEVMTPERTKTK